MVSSSMETRQLRKRRWKSSPNKTARAELDFGQKTPSPKKPRRDENSRADIEEDQESFTIKSFYGKREKTCFPHSPGRRKKVGQVLKKITDENIESEDEKKDKRTVKTEKSVNTKDSKRDFQFHSSDSADTDTESKTKSSKTSRSSKKASSRKVPLDIKVNKKEPKTPRNNTRSGARFLSNSTSKLPNRSALREVEPQVQTPNSGKRFFKTRSPASADKCFGSIVVHKGFNLQFVASKKAHSSKTPKYSTNKSNSKEKRPIPKGVSVKSLKKTVAVEDGIIYVEDKQENLAVHDDTEIHENKTVEEIDQANANDMSDLENNFGLKQITDEVEKTDHLKGRELNDSAIDTANSEDLFSNVSENSEPVDRHQLNNEINSQLEQTESGPTTPSRRTPSSSVSPASESSSIVSGSQRSQSGKKLFPIFNQGARTPQSSGSLSLGKLRSRTSPSGSPLLRYRKSKDKKEQMIIQINMAECIQSTSEKKTSSSHHKNTGEASLNGSNEEMDAGQKKFGVTQCGVCTMVYTQADPADEMMHHKFHQGLINALRFPGWKKEHVVQEYLDVGSRIIMIQAKDPSYATKKVEEINSVMGRELGFPDQNMIFMPDYKAFLYISSEKMIEGCCITEPIKEGYPVIPGSQSHSPSPQKHPGQRPWYCSEKPKKALVGISKIWVYAKSRKQGIATRLLECVRHWSEYGNVVPKEKVAFSDPTPDGKKLAEKYIGSPEFLVYKFQ